MTAGRSVDDDPAKLTGSITTWTSRKYDGSAHRRADVHLLGSDAFGTWLTIEQGTLVDFAGSSRPHPCNQLTLLATGGNWHLSWLQGHDPALYVDIATNTIVTQHGIESVDLDLDVVRWTDGVVEVLDVDEFHEHSAAMSYPPFLVAEVPRLAQYVADMLSRQIPPFCDVPPDRWRSAHS